MSRNAHPIFAAVFAALAVFVAPRAAAQADAPEPAVVSVLGASVSAGFVDPKPRPDGEPNSTVKLSRAMRGLWAADTVRVRDRSDVSTFLDPAAKQARHVERAVRDAPTVTVAVDFLFWFGCGRVGGDEREARLALQRQGLELLERIEGPALIGDYPDMTGADPRMISAAQIPSPEVLAALNEQLRAWAAGREQVRVFPLSEFVIRAKGDGIAVRHGDVDLVLRRDVLLQGDGLHATRLGAAVIADAVAGALREMLPGGHVARPIDATLADLAESTGALILLDELAAAARPTAGVGGGR